jgi:O-methyltransferase involved in polyketide biosynthesis
MQKVSGAMTDDPVSHARTGIDTSVPHSARIWNYWLGGKDNYEADRLAGDAWLAEDPDMLDLARASRAFLGRAVRYLATEQGVRQFLDVGTGLPTADNTHEVAQRAAPDARVVYVDHDPLVLAHARALLIGTPEGATRYIDADMRDTDALISGAQEILDFTQPVALIFSGVLGHIGDFDEARSLVRTLVDALPSGSFLVISDGGEDEAALKAAEEYARTGAIPYHVRPYRDVIRFFDGLEWIDPGFVLVNEWRPDSAGAISITGRPIAPKKVSHFAGIARKR